jgi:hypothetical protein
MLTREQIESKIENYTLSSQQLTSDRWGAESQGRTRREGRCRDARESRAAV